MTAAEIYGVDESVSGAVLLPRLQQVIGSGKMAFILLPRLDNAEELCRQLQLWQQTLQLPWRIELLNEVQRGRFYIAGSESDRARVLTMIAHQRIDVVIASLAGVLAPAPAVEHLRNSEIRLRLGDNVSFSGLLAKLVELDYDDEYEVASPGEFSRRGGIIDVFSSNAEYPARIEFFGDEIDSIRLFDPATQRSLPQKVDEYCIINRCTIQTLTDEEGNAYENTVPALDYFDNDKVAFFELYNGFYDEYFQRFGDEDQRRIYQKFLRRWTEPDHVRIFSASEGTPGDVELCGIYPAAAHILKDLPGETASCSSELLASQWQMQFKQWHDSQYDIIICGCDENSPQRLQEYFRLNQWEKSGVEFAVMDLPGGLLDFAGRYVLITENELLSGMQSSRKAGKKAPPATPEDQELKLENAVISDLEPGRYAVHTSYGIALYKGMKIDVAEDGSSRELMILEYADNAILQVPIHQASSVSCYIGGGRNSSVKVHRLGSVRWAKDKQKTAEAIHQYAAEMLRLQAVRAASPGLEIAPDPLAVQEFAARFKFTETADQLRSIEEIDQDLAGGKPMDRLLCGDVGYGKTEAAMRAAFKVVNAGYQVAVIVPTTVLAQQHYLSFLERFAGYPFTIDVLSRFRSAGEQNTVISHLASGGVDIVIGTHRLASADVKFKNLGLVIIDEEQRFGVKVKEQLLRMRADVNVLTMSATPIPRTLYLSMAGARQLSTIMTAPVERLPVKTIVMREDDNALAMIIKDEIARGGQVYLVHNRVRSINDRLKKLSALLPDVRMAVGHGQMAEHELESVMQEFVNGQLQVLIATTIIESGLDVPNANTIIIERADRFGLAELYQLRGRVGRWRRQAYAYMVIPEQSFITPDGRKRIAAIRRCTQLGAGMKLALRDLEIRGAGNLLGSEQSGHINAVGFELYCQLLKNEIALLKAGKAVQWLPDVELNVEFIRYALHGTDKFLAAGVPVEYIESERIRLNIFRTLGRLTGEEQIKALHLELSDRFGKLPPETENLLTLTLIKVLAAQAGFRSIAVQEGKVLMRKRSSDTYRSNGRLPRISDALSLSGKLKELLRIVQLAKLESIAQTQ
ncbi:MAG: transcription-repair coupling factor [Lentisphaerae bacterium]|nr:transcription-repair coupling factor [Lentisphaerota bacterium]